jgi:hypothetical protein
MKQTIFFRPSKIAFLRTMVGEGWDSPRGKGVQHVESMKRERNIMRYLSETGPVTSSD